MKDEDTLQRFQRYERELKIPKKDIRTILSGELRATPAMEAAKEFVVGDRQSNVTLVLSGPAGAGKTTAASWALAALVDPGVLVPSRKSDWHLIARGLFIHASMLAGISRYASADIGELLSARALVIDDLGTEYNDEKGSFLATFDMVFNHRYAQELPTIITTNCVAKVFSERYGERVVDRIRESGDFVGVANDSLRSK